MIAAWWKVSEAAFLDVRLERLSAPEFRHWFKLCCIASINGGALPEIEQIALMLGASVAMVEKRIERLVAAGLFVEGEGGLEPAEVGPCPMARKGGETAPEPRGALSNAERQRAYRARKKAEEGSAPVTERYEGITERYGNPLPKESELEIKTNPARIAREGRDDHFENFLAAFPDRGADNPRGPAFAAWRRAVSSGAEPEEIVRAAKAYRAAVGGRERRFICSAARWLSEGRWRGEGAAPGLSKPGAPPVSSGLWIAADSPEGRAWAEHWRATRGKSPPMDARGGWRFPSLVPPIEKEIAA
ncbi:hypothetical protein AMST5_04100 [freshwater sediment metagenome]|uniref:Uncharacterized protein n=1 Tax=freshwater sediment metagenome TaxID=556182 RepID=A0AA48M6F0_9ZZZZ